MVDSPYDKFFFAFKFNHFAWRIRLPQQKQLGKAHKSIDRCV